MLVQANRSAACSFGVVFPHDPYPSEVRDAEEPAPVQVVLSLYLPYILFIPDRIPTHALVSKPLSDVQLTQMVAIPATVVLPSTSTW